MLLNIESLIRDSELMLKRRASLLSFLCILGQAGVIGELGELLTDQSNRHKVEHVGAIFSSVLHFTQQRNLHALSPPPAARYALSIIHAIFNTCTSCSEICTNNQLWGRLLLRMLNK